MTDGSDTTQPAGPASPALNLAHGDLLTMTITKRLMTAFVLCPVVTVAGPGFPDPPQQPAKQQPGPEQLTVAEFDRLHKKLTTMSTEKVWSIPWQLSVREARERAARENKPDFLWISSNGGTHPLGPC